MSADLMRAVIASATPYAYFVEMDWAGEKERFWTGLGNYDWQHPDDDQERVWYGTGNMGKITLPERTGEVKVEEVIFEVSGVDGSLQSRVNEDIRGGEVAVWHCFMGPDYKVMAVQEIQSGVLDRAVWIEDGESNTIQVYARGDFPFLDNQEISRWTPEDQRDFLSALGEDPDTDTGFDLVHTMQDKNLAWIPS